MHLLGWILSAVPLIFYLFQQKKYVVTSYLYIMYLSLFTFYISLVLKKFLIEKWLQLFSVSSNLLIVIFKVEYLVCIAHRKKV